MPDFERRSSSNLNYDVNAKSKRIASPNSSSNSPIVSNKGQNKGKFINLSFKL